MALFLRRCSHGRGAGPVGRAESGQIVLKAAVLPRLTTAGRMPLPRGASYATETERK